jgi:hypothetical protein
MSNDNEIVGRRSRLIFETIKPRLTAIIINLTDRSPAGLVSRLMPTLRILTAPVFRPLLEPARYKGAYGGRGSGKSQSFGELLVERCLSVRARARFAFVKCRCHRPGWMFKPSAARYCRAGKS